MYEVIIKDRLPLYFKYYREYVDEYFGDFDKPIRQDIITWFISQAIQESGLNPNAFIDQDYVNAHPAIKIPSYATGIGQITPSTWDTLHNNYPIQLPDTNKLFLRITLPTLYRNMTGYNL